MVDHDGRAVRIDQFAQPGERLVDLRQRCLVRLEVARVAGEQEAALSGFGLPDQRERLVDGRLHFQRGRHRAVGEFEASIADLREPEDAQRNDDTQGQRQEHTQREQAFHRCGGQRAFRDGGYGRRWTRHYTWAPQGPQAHRDGGVGVCLTRGSVDRR